jgi:hypothetical protein
MSYRRYAVYKCAFCSEVKKFPLTEGQGHVDDSELALYYEHHYQEKNHLGDPTHLFHFMRYEVAN